MVEATALIDARGKHVATGFWDMIRDKWEMIHLLVTLSMLGELLLTLYFSQDRVRPHLNTYIYSIFRT